MRRFLYYLFPLLILCLFVLIMHSEKFLKKPSGRADNVPHYLSALKEDLRIEQWEKAGQDLTKLKQAYKKIVPRIQFGAEKNDLNQLQVNLARTQGAILAQNKADGLLEISEAEEHWRRLGK